MQEHITVSANRSQEERRFALTVQGSYRRSENVTTLNQDLTIGLGGKCVVRDFWKKRDVDKFENEYSVAIPWHGAVLCRVTPE